MECNIWILIGTILTFIALIAKWVFDMGKLRQKVTDLDTTLNNGLCAKVNEIAEKVAGMDNVDKKVDKLTVTAAELGATVSMYIKMNERNK